MANYLYNGVELPALPEWDKETYPYACIIPLGDYHAPPLAYLYCSTALFHFKKEWAETGMREYCAIEDGSFIRYIYSTDSSIDPNNFVRETSEDVRYFTANGVVFGMNATSNKIKWANYDVKRLDDDSTYLAASEPVPVREYPTASEVTLSPQSVEVTAGQAQDIQFTLTGTDGTDYTGIATWAYAITDKNGTVSKDDAPWVSWVSAEDGSVLLRITADAPVGHEITVIAAWGTEDDPQNLWANVTIPVKRVSEAWLRSFKTGLALGLCGSALDIHSAPPAYIWDEESGMLIVNRDEGSLIYDFNRNTFHLNVTQQY